MTTKLYSIFDQANIGTSLQLSNSNQVVTTTVGGLTVNRMVRCLYPQDTFLSNCEWMVFGTGAITNLAYVGIVDASAVTTKYVGQDTHGYGLKLSDGNLYSNGSSVASIGVCAANDIIGMAFNPLDLSLTFWKNGALLGSYTLPGSGPWYPACSIGSTVAGDLSVFFNAGQQAFQYPLAGATGWWTPIADVNPVRWASEDFTSPTTDAVPNATYDGVISPQSSMLFVRMISPYVWRDSASGLSGGQSYGTITIDDPGTKQADGSISGKYDYLVSLDFRDTAFAASRVISQDNGGSTDSAQIISTAVVDRVDTAGDFQKNILIKDAMAKLEGAVQRSLLLPNVDPSAVGKTIPIVEGCVRTIPAVLIGTKKFQFTDQPIAQIGDVRVAGKLINNPPDWSMNSDFRGITTAVDPQGKFTADISTVGGSVIGLTTVLISSGQDYGDFTNGAIYTSPSDLTTYWDVGGYLSNLPALAITGSDPGAAYPRLEMGPEGLAGEWTYIKTKTNICTAGHTWIAEIWIESSAPIPQNTGQPAYLYVGPFQAPGALTRADAFTYNPHIQNTLIPSGYPGKFYLTFTNTTGSNLPLMVGYQANNFAGPFGEGLGKIKYIKLYDVGAATSFVNLTGTSLAPLLQALIETEGGLTASDWDIAAAQAIDASTGYTSLGTYIADATTIRNACQPALDSHCADFVVLRDGTISIIRLVDPGTITSSGTIDESVILGRINLPHGLEKNLSLSAQSDSMIAFAPDQAPGLTTKMGARKNWSKYTQGDFGSTNLTDAPNSLRAALTQDFQSIAASGAQLSRSYLYAQQAQALASSFDSVTEAQTEIDRVCALYTVLRYFYAVPVKADKSDTYEIGQAWNLVYPRYGLSGGKPVLIVGMTEDPINEQLTLICWG